MRMPHGNADPVGIEIHLAEAALDVLSLRPLVHGGNLAIARIRLRDQRDHTTGIWRALEPLSARDGSQFISLNCGQPSASRAAP